ncbi:MAG: hypothetical protein ABIQ62_09430, partial [Thermomonas sp.]
MKIKTVTAALAVAFLAGCASTPPPKKPSTTKADLGFTLDPYPSSYQRVAAPPVLLQHATVLTGTGTRLEDAD